MSTTQFATFKVEGRFYGIDVRSVQEITMSLPVTKVPLAPACIHGLTNLRGQIATAIGVRELFKLSETPGEITMNVVCKCDNMLLSLVVDEIGDVLELDDRDFEEFPETVPTDVGQFMTGVYKIQPTILSVVDIKKIVEHLSK